MNGSLRSGPKSGSGRNICLIMENNLGIQFMLTGSVGDLEVHLVVVISYITGNHDVIMASSFYLVA